MRTALQAVETAPKLHKGSEARSGAEDTGEIKDWWLQKVRL